MKKKPLKKGFFYGWFCIIFKQIHGKAVFSPFEPL